MLWRDVGADDTNASHHDKKKEAVTAALAKLNAVDLKIKPQAITSTPTPGATPEAQHSIDYLESQREKVKSLIDEGETLRVL